MTAATLIANLQRDVAVKKIVGASHESISVPHIYDRIHRMIYNFITTSIILITIAAETKCARDQTRQ